MAYNAVPTITTGDVATAAWGNTYIKDNFAAGVPDIFTTDGDMVVGTGANAAERVAVMNASNLITHEVGGLESNVSSGDGLVQVKAGATTVIKSNIAASSNPGTGDDTDDGYAIGSFWLNTTADRPYVCLDASSGAAVWKEMSGITNVVEDTSPQLGGNLDMQARLLVGNGGTTGIAIDSVGAVNMALQPSMTAKVPTDITNVTGDATNYTFVFATELYDQGSDWDGVSTWTAPITGRYLVILAPHLDGLLATHTVSRFNLIETDATFNVSAGDLGAQMDAGNEILVNMIKVIDMDAGNTLTTRMRITNGTKVVDVTGYGWSTLSIALLH